MKFAHLVLSVVLASVPIAVGCSSIGTSTPSESQKASKAIVDEFFALDSRLKVGLSFVEYGNQLADLQVSLDKLERSAGVESEAYKSLNLALDDYQQALTVWEYCTEHCDESKTFEIWNITHNVSIYNTEEIGPLLTETYNVPTTVTESDIGPRTQFKSIALNPALTAIWAKAGERIGEADKDLM